MSIELYGLLGSLIAILGGLVAVWLLGLPPWAASIIVFMGAMQIIIAVAIDGWRRPDEPTNWTWTSNQYTSRKP